MKDDEKAFLEKMRAAQEIRVGDGLGNRAIEGKVALREALKSGGSEWGSLQDTGEYDAVLKFHCRV